MTDFDEHDEAVAKLIVDDISPMRYGLECRCGCGEQATHWIMVRSIRKVGAVCAGHYFVNTRRDIQQRRHLRWLKQQGRTHG